MERIEEQLKSKKYEKVTVAAGMSIDECMRKLWTLEEHGIKCYAKFNGIILLGEDNINTAYYKVTGCDKLENDSKIIKNYSDTEFNKKIPKIVMELLIEGRSVIDNNLIEEWDKRVIKEIYSIYRDKILRDALVIMKLLSNEEGDNEIKETLTNQDHSGESLNILLGLLNEFNVDRYRVKELCSI